MTGEIAPPWSKTDLYVTYSSCFLLMYVYADYTIYSEIYTSINSREEETNRLTCKGSLLDYLETIEREIHNYRLGYTPLSFPMRLYDNY